MTPTKNDLLDVVAVVTVAAVATIGILVVCHEIVSASKYTTKTVPIVIPVCGLSVSPEIALMKETKDYFKGRDGVTYTKPLGSYGETGKTIEVTVKEDD